MYNIVQDFYCRKTKPKGKISKGSTVKHGETLSTKANNNGKQTELQVTCAPVPEKKKRRQVPNMPEPEKPRKICLVNCRYDVVRRMAMQAGFQETETESEPWNILWSDFALTVDKALEMRRFQDAHTIFWGTETPLQKSNHFPGMSEICRKDKLASNLNRMKKLFPNEYNFFPKSWALPSDLSDLVLFAKDKKDATYICKPDCGSQGKGIFLIRNIKQINPTSKLICQIYIPRPLLLNGYKFDLRIYILITCCDPLRLYVYNEGIARFATIKYSPPTDDNVDIVFMHLTNYSLNKFSQSYVADCDGSKRKLSDLYGFLLQQGYNVSKITDAIDDLVVKTVISGQPTLQHYYRTTFPKTDRGTACFEILGFDILIDENLKPWLLEVNHSPSFNLDLPVDVEVKEALLRDTFSKIYLGSFEQRGNRGSGRRPSLLTSECRDPMMVDFVNGLPKTLEMQFHYEKIHQGNYRLVYPAKHKEEYDELFKNLTANLMELADLEEGGDNCDPKLFLRGSDCLIRLEPTVIPARIQPEERIAYSEMSSGLIGKGFPKNTTTSKPTSKDCVKSNALSSSKRPGSNGTNIGTLKSKIMEPCKGETKVDDQISFPSEKRKISNRNSFTKNVPKLSQYDIEFKDFNPQVFPSSEKPVNKISKPPIQPKPKRDYVKEAIERAQKAMEQKKILETVALMPRLKSAESSSTALDKKFIQIKKRLADIRARELQYSNSDRIPLRQQFSPKFNTTEPHNKGKCISGSSFNCPYPFPDNSFLYPTIFNESKGESFVHKNQIKQAELLKLIPAPARVNPRNELNVSAEPDINNNKNTKKDAEIESKTKSIEEWITTGVEERTRSIVQSQYSVLRNRHCAKQRKGNTIPKLGSGVHICEDNNDDQPRRLAEYFRPPEIHQRIRSIHKHNGNMNHLHHSPSLDILPQEENERRAELMNRDKLIRDLGIDAQAHAIVNNSWT